ncbi:hypothetical protein [Legionella jamestowniensis]|uniref:Uncharacterized protein n=1 Tax=Legionella jamestowniensis TaxID=455 RepID=A0A0W0UZP3_9GAMM|nr:hypothetical protein [Legionella jamestowniensis]KTD13323.1 hypothetical protein Ljam_0113 [Legionella jamestowniensis]SFL77076.1 hypothetical protein SAMN02746073_1815 [Legionella jamestowniensis DSM 19215]
MANSTKYMLVRMEKTSSDKSATEAAPVISTSNAKASAKESSMQKLVQECLIKKDQLSNTPYS